MTNIAMIAEAVTLFLGHYGLGDGVLGAGVRGATSWLRDRLIETAQDGSDEWAKRGRIVSTCRRVAVGHLLAEELRELEADGMIDRERTGKPPAPVMCFLTGCG